MKKIIAFFMMLVFTVTVTTGCFAAEPVTENNHTQVFLLTMQVGNPIMTVNGTESEIDPGRGTAPIIQNGRTLVPIRAIIEAMGGSVNWDEETQTVLLELEGDIITLYTWKYYPHILTKQQAPSMLLPYPLTTEQCCL